MIKKTMPLLLSSLVLLASTSAWGAIKSEKIEYSDGNTSMEGFVYYDDTQTSPRPGILLVHDWMGLGEFTKNKAAQLAKEGYVAFAADIYGKGVHPANSDQAGQLANKYKSDRPLLRTHIRAAYDKLTAMKQVNPKEILVMGYCFGGMTALELARSGAPLVGTVTFHGVLSSPTPEDAKNIHGRVLAFHGADDPYVSPSEVQAFKDEMEKANVNFTFIAYPGVVHSFTNPAAGNDKSKGMAYNAQADESSWKSFEQFMKEVFGKSS